jgi:Na+-driven multidrug efflux pump
MVIDNVTVWCFSLPLAFLTGYFLNFGIAVVYLAVVLDDGLKFLLLRRRVGAGKWTKNLT